MLNKNEYKKKQIEKYREKKVIETYLEKRRCHE